jgi:3'-5' exoribonuclease
MAQPIPIPSLNVGDRVEDPFVILEVNTRTLKDGDPFTVLTIGNATGRIATEPFWPERQGEVAGLRPGHVVQVLGEVQTYRDRKQIKVVSLRHLPEGAVDPTALLPSVGPVDRYWDTLDTWRREIRKPRLRRVVDVFYEDEDFRKRYERCPAAVFGHHAALGGLLKHTTEVAAIARTITRACGADGELVLAGVLLHDIGKLESYRWQGVFEYTDRGRLLGHVVLGVLMLERRLAEQVEPLCTPLERDILFHIILSHHGKLEFGSPVTPMMLEAEVLHWADNASAKTASVQEALSDDQLFPDGDVSVVQRFLDNRRLYRGQSDWGAE